MSGTGSSNRDAEIVLATKRREVVIASMALMTKWLELRSGIRAAEEEDVLDGTAMSLVEELQNKPVCDMCGQEISDAFHGE